MKRRIVSAITILSILFTQSLFGIFNLVQVASAAPSDNFCNGGDATITTPASGSFNKGVITVSWTFNGVDCTTAGADPKVLDIEASHDGGATWLPIGPSANPDITSITFDSTNLAFGTSDDTDYQFRLNAGGTIVDNTSYSDIIIDNTVPTLTSIALTESTPGYINSVTPELTITASDATAGVKDMAFSCDNATYGSWVPYSGTYSSFNVRTGEGCADVDGAKTVYVKVRDNALNESVGSVNDGATLDSTNPTVNAGADKTTNALFTQDATVDGAVSGVATYAWTNETPGVGAITFGTAAAEDTTITADTDGTYTIRLTVTDNAGNTAFDDFTLVWDTVAGVTGDDVPATWETSDVTVTLTCADVGGTGCSKVYYTTDGSDPDTSSSFVDVAGSWQFTVSTDGDYVVKYRSEDVAGNLEAVKTAANNLRLDKTNPDTSSITSPTDGAIIGGTKQIVASATDATSGVAGVAFYYNNTEDTVSPVLIDTDTTDPYTANFDTSVLADGTWYLYVVALDKAGNSTTSTIIGVTIDNTKPVIANLNFPEEAATTAILAGLATHNSFNITQVEYFIDTVGADDAGIDLTLGAGTKSVPFNGTIDVSALADGVHTIYVHAKNSELIWGNTYGSITFVKNANEYYTKIEVDDLFTTKLADYYSTGEIDNMLENYYLKTETYSTGEVDGLIAGLGATYYTEAEINLMFSDYYDSDDIDLMFEGYYTSGQVNTLLSTTLADYYTETEVNNILLNYYDNTEVYTKTEVNDLIAGLTDTYYTEAEIDAMFTNYYTQGQIDAMFAAMVAPTFSYTPIANQFNVSAVPESINFDISDNSEVTSLILKDGANITDVFENYGDGSYNLYLSNTEGLHEYKLIAGDAQGNKTTETITYFVVADSVTNVNIEGFSISNLDADGVTVLWDTDETSSVSKVDFYTNESQLLNQGAAIDGTSNFFTTNGLLPNKTYTVVIKSKVTGQSNYTTLTFTIKTASSNNGIAVTKIERILNGNDPTAGGDYGSGYHFRFHVTANNLDETLAKFKLADWSNGATTMAVTNNTKVIFSAGGVNTDTSEGGVGETRILSAANTYTAGNNVGGIDGDEVTGGRQFVIDVFYKIPAGSAGIYSTSYGIKTEIIDD